MAAIMASFAWDFDKLSVRQRGMMRMFADAQEREQAADRMIGRPMVPCDPSNLARMAVSRTADNEERVLRLFLIVLNVEQLTKNDAVRDRPLMIGPQLPTPLEAAKMVLKLALQAIAWRDSVRFCVEHGVRRLGHGNFVAIFTAIRPVCTDEYFDAMWTDLMQVMVAHRLPQESLDFFDAQYETIASKYAETSEDDETAESGDSSTD